MAGGQSNYTEMLEISDNVTTWQSFETVVSGTESRNHDSILTSHDMARNINSIFTINEQLYAIGGISFCQFNEPKSLFVGSAENTNKFYMLEHEGKGNWKFLFQHSGYSTNVLRITYSDIQGYCSF